MSVPFSHFVVSSTFWFDPSVLRSWDRLRHDACPDVAYFFRNTDGEGDLHVILYQFFLGLVCHFFSFTLCCFKSEC